MQLWCNSQRRKRQGSCLHLMITSLLVICRLHEAASFYQRALLANALTSALRLHQRLPHFQLSRAFLAQALLEDSCHYLLYSLIFVNSYPVTSILLYLFDSEIAYWVYRRSLLIIFCCRKDSAMRVFHEAWVGWFVGASCAWRYIKCKNFWLWNVKSKFWRADWEF